jgi:hypothetical protein
VSELPAPKAIDDTPASVVRKILTAYGCTFTVLRLVLAFGPAVHAQTKPQILVPVRPVVQPTPIQKERQ